MCLLTNLTQILSDLIEDLGIKLEVTELSIRDSINADREMLGLKPLPPHDEDFGPQYSFTKYAKREAPVCHVIIYSIP
jgi:hypothetical protein